MPGTGCDGRPGGGATSTALKPATTSGKPANHEDNEVPLEYYWSFALWWPPGGSGLPTGGSADVATRRVCRVWCVIWRAEGGSIGGASVRLVPREPSDASVPEPTCLAAGPAE